MSLGKPRAVGSLDKTWSKRLKTLSKQLAGNSKLASTPVVYLQIIQDKELVISSTIIQRSKAAKHFVKLRQPIGVYSWAMEKGIPEDWALLHTRVPRPLEGNSKEGARVTRKGGHVADYKCTCTHRNPGQDTQQGSKRHKRRPGPKTCIREKAVD